LINAKESFRIYRKKAKEIFEAQQQSSGGGVSSTTAMSMTSSSPSDAKLSYLKNLVLNYLTSDATVRDHMLGAIGTVLQFSAEEKQRIAAKQSKQNDSSWF
jgi:GRIP domain